MVNYDLPWNPNRLNNVLGEFIVLVKQKFVTFGILFDETREGDVFNRLRKKSNKKAVHLVAAFDVLGRIHFDNKPFENFIEAIRYGERPDVKARLIRLSTKPSIEKTSKSFLEERSLATTSMDIRKVMAIKEQMERFEARKLQPHFIAPFFSKLSKNLVEPFTKENQDDTKSPMSQLLSAIGIG